MPFAYRRAPRTYGVRPLAAMPSTASLAVGWFAARSPGPGLLGRSSDCSEDLRNAESPPAMSRDEQAGRHGKRGRAFACIEYPKPSAGSRAEVKEAAALRKALRNCVDGFRYLGQHGANGKRDGLVGVVDDGEHVKRGELVDLLGGRVARFGG